MNHIPEIIDNYLSRNTDYAILLTGQWGSGKTHYFKNKLVPFIESKGPQDKPTIKYKVIYISLYGKESIRSIEAAVLAEILPIFKNPVSVLAKNVFNMLAKTVKIEVKDIDNLIHGTLPNGTSTPMIDYDTVVFCFDDFERRDEKLKANEILGFLDNLANSNAKILVISNEEKDNSAYKLNKEKTIGLAITYAPIKSEIITDILKTRFSANSEYCQFIIENLKVIEEYIKTNNIRTINYALDCFEDAYVIVEKEFKNETKLKEILLRLIKFTMAVSIEFKESRISYHNLTNFRNMSLDEIADMYRQVAANTHKITTSTDADNTTESLKTNFDSKYYNNEDADFYESLFLYITTFNKKNLDNLKNEIVNKFALQSNDLPEHIHVYSLLANTPLKLSTQEYNTNLNKFYTYIKEGVYEYPMHYLNALAILYKYNNPLNLNPDDILSNIKTGIDKANFSNFPDLDLFDFDGHILKDKQEILVNYMIENERNRYELSREDLSKEIESKFLSGDFDEFRRFNFENFKSIEFPYFKHFSIQKSIQFLSSIDLEFVYRFGQFISTRNIKERKEEERPFFDAIVEYSESIHGDPRKEKIFGVLKDNIKKLYN